MDCKTLTNANAGGIETYGFTSGLLFAGKNPGGMAVSAAKTKEAWENLMLLNTNNGRLMLINRTEQREIGEPEVISAPSDFGDIPADYKEAAHTFDKYVGDCGMKSILGSLKSGADVYGYEIKKGNYIRGTKDSEGNFAPIKMFLHAVGIQSSPDSPIDKVRISLSYRDDAFLEKIWTLKPDFDVDELTSVTDIEITELVASDSADTVEFVPKTCSGCVVSDFGLENYKFTAGGAVITPTATPTQADDGKVTATFTADDVSGDIVVSADSPATTEEFYEVSGTYSVTAS
jgi:hypothetical protein